jgi:hypothetical protein
MDKKSSWGSSRWSLVVIIDCMQRDDCLFAHGVDVGLQDGTGSPSRRSQAAFPRWVYQTILDGDSLLRGSVHARAAAQVQPAVQGRGRADGARDRQAHRRGRPRPGINEGTLNNWARLSPPGRVPGSRWPSTSSLQPPTTALHARLPNPVRRTHRLPPRGDRRGLINRGPVQDH